MIVKMIQDLRKRMEAQTKKIKEFFFLLAMLCGLWDLSSLTSD